MNEIPVSITAKVARGRALEAEHRRKVLEHQSEASRYGTAVREAKRSGRPLPVRPTMAGRADKVVAKQIQPFDNFRVRITAGDSVACGINKIVLAHGLALSDQCQNGHIVAVAALEKVYSGGGIAGPKDGARALSAALTAAVQAWGHQPSSLNGKTLEALGLVQLRYNGSIDQKALAAKLAPFPGGAPGLLGKAKAMQEVRGRPLHHCAASLIVDAYNRGRRVGKLPAWES